MTCRISIDKQQHGYIYIYPIMQVEGDLVVGTGIRLMADEQPCLQSL